jgi:hypothetical protein
VGWQGSGGLWGEDGHELLEWLERLPQFEGGRLGHFEVGEERRVVKGIEPGPTRHSFVVVLANPIQGLQVGVADVVFQLQELRGFDVELLSVILLLVAVQLMAED